MSTTEGTLASWRITSTVRALQRTLTGPQRPLRHLEDARHARDAILEAIDLLAKAARREGATYAEIGRALGISRQAARQATLMVELDRATRRGSDLARAATTARPATTEEREGASPLQSPAPTGIGGREWSGFCSARLRGGRDVARDVRRRRARDFVPCAVVAGRRRASVGVRRVIGSQHFPATTHVADPVDLRAVQVGEPDTTARTLLTAHANTPSSPQPRHTQTSPLRTSRIDR